IQQVWHRLVEPVADSVSGALAQALTRNGGPAGLGTGLDGPMAAMMGGPAAAMMRQVGGSVFGMQVGQAIGTLATEIVSGTEIGLPLVEPGTVVLLPAAVAKFGEGLDVPLPEVRL